MRHWVTYADKHYLSRLKALHASLVRHAGPFRLSVLAWDREVAEWAEHYPATVDATTSSEFLADHPELQPENLPGPPRSKVERFWTCGPQFIADVMEGEGQPVTYVDADCFAFSSPEPMFEEIGGAPAAFCGHNFATAAMGLPGPTVETHSVFGLLNVGVNYFADIAIARTWAEACRRWCFERVERVEEEAGRGVPIANRRLRYGDQRYLQDMVEENPAIHVVKNVAAMVGPWNLHTRPLEERDGQIYFGDRPLGFYHFSSLVLGPHGQWSPTRPEYQLTDRQIEVVYRPYLVALGEASK